MKRCLSILWLFAMPAWADESVTICYGYGCAKQVEVTYDDAHLRSVRKLLRGATSAEQERRQLALALGLLYRWGGQQTPIHNDKGGDYADDGVDGRMDCIDHATSTTRLLQMIAAQGWLRYHRVLEPARRTRFLIMQHFSAVIEEAGLLPISTTPRPAFAIDTWFRDNGLPAVVMPLDTWMGGSYPDD